MFDKKQKHCVKHIHLVTDYGLYNQKAVYKVKIVFIHPLWMMENLSIITISGNYRKSRMQGVSNQSFFKNHRCKCTPFLRGILNMDMDMEVEIEIGYGQVSYLILVCEDNEIHCSLLIGKSRGLGFDRKITINNIFAVLRLYFWFCTSATIH